MLFCEKLVMQFIDIRTHTPKNHVFLTLKTECKGVEEMPL